MKKIHIFTMLLVGLFFTIPWFFFDGESKAVAGMPVWAFYSLFFTFTYACFIFILVKKYWGTSAGNSPEEAN
jgi:hypothetical protein